MEKNSKRAQIIWRYTIVSAIILLLAGGILFKAIDTTIAHADQWNQKADTLLSRIYYVQPLRGDILADDGTVLATSITAYDISLDYRTIAKRDSIFFVTIDSLSEALAVNYPVRSKEDWKKYLALPFGKKPQERTQCHMILRGASYDDYQRILNFPFFNRYRKKYSHGLCASPRQVRMMPYGDMAHRSIGRCDRMPTPNFVGAKSRKDSVDMLHGYSGLEAALDSLLRGKQGKAKVVPLTRGVGNWVQEPAVDGYTLRTTININMQDIVENELQAVLQATNADWGTCVLMHVPTGDIKAISNLEKSKKEPGKYIEAMNYALRGYEPGSVMKPISMIIALEDGYAFPLNKVYPIGSSYPYAGGQPIHDTHSPASLPVSRFLEYSSNIGMTRLLAPRYSDSNLNGFRERLRDIGFLDSLGTGMAGERRPYFPTLDPKRGGRVSLSRMTYGYASQIPPLYTCAIYNAIANGGKFVRPRMVSELIRRDGTIIPKEISYVRDSVCSRKNAKILMEMLESVVYGEGGTAKSLKNDIVRIVGKTGTSRIAYESRRDSTGKLIPGPVGYKEGQLRLAFCGVFPYENPQYTCMVLISNPSPQFRGAATTSGLVVKNVAFKMYSHGMLGRYSDYQARQNPGTQPTMYASDFPMTRSSLQRVTGTEKGSQFKTPTAPSKGTVPDVSGLGIREALARIENAGYAIEAHGVGFAVSQMPSAGSIAKPGDKITVKFATR